MKDYENLTTVYSTPFDVISDMQLVSRANQIFARKVATYNLFLFKMMNSWHWVHIQTAPVQFHKHLLPKLKVLCGLQIGLKQNRIFLLEYGYRQDRLQVISRQKNASKNSLYFANLP